MCYNKLNNNKLFCYGLYCILIFLLDPFDWYIEFEILTYRAFIKRNEANKYENDISITKIKHGPRLASHRNLFKKKKKNWSKQTESRNGQVISDVLNYEIIIKNICETKTMWHFIRPIDWLLTEYSDRIDQLIEITCAQKIWYSNWFTGGKRQENQ